MDIKIRINKKVSVVLSFLLSMLILVVTPDAFSHGIVFMLLGYLGIIIAIIGIFASTMFFLGFKDIGSFLLRIFSLIGILYSLIYMILDSDARIIFLFFLLSLPQRG